MQFKWHEWPQAELYGDVRSSKSAKGSESDWDLKDTHLWSRSTGSPEARRLSSPTCWTWRPTRPGLPSGEAASGRTWKSVTSGLRLYENRIQTSRPLVNQRAEVVNSVQRDFSAVSVLQQVLLRTGTCAWDFASLLHPVWAQGGQRFWLSASRLLLWTAHKTMAFQFDPERQKNCLLRVMHLSYLKDKDSMLNHQGKVFPNFYLRLLPLFANTQFPDYSLILPAFLATSLFLVAFYPFNIFNCPSPFLALFPPSYFWSFLFSDVICFWFRG